MCSCVCMHMEIVGPFGIGVRGGHETQLVTWVPVPNSCPNDCAASTLSHWTISSRDAYKLYHMLKFLCILAFCLVLLSLIFIQVSIMLLVAVIPFLEWLFRCHTFFL